ncbi:MAG: hypothetical protein ABI234_06280 [Ktedonobacteraceae bacterium]
MAVNDYFASIPQLADPPRSLGYCEVLPHHRKRQQMEEAMSLLREPAKGDWENWPKDAQQMQLW